MRQYGEIPPWNAAPNTPKVGAVTTMGTGGEAGVQTSDSSGFGDIYLKTGRGAIPTAGNVTLVFPVAPTIDLFIAGDEAFGALTITGQQTTTVTIAWTTATLLRETRYRIHYEWINSR